MLSSERELFSLFNNYIHDTMEGVEMQQVEPSGEAQLVELLGKIRVDAETKMASVLDVIIAINNSSSREASVYFKRLDPEWATKCCRVKINGKGHETPVADAKTLIQIVWALGGKKAKAFRVQCSEYICRILGGDPTLVREMELRAAVTPPEQREFFMQNVPVPNLPPMQDREFIKNRVDSADTTIRLNQLIGARMPAAGRDVYMFIQAYISDALFGIWPGEFMKQNDIPHPKYNGPDIMTKAQLSARFAMQSAACMMLEPMDGPYTGTNGDAFVRDFKQRCEGAKMMFAPFHGMFQVPTELTQVRLATPPAALPIPIQAAPHIQHNYNAAVTINNNY
jgi:hypothetical protein